MGGTYIGSNHISMIGKVMESIKENIKYSSNWPNKKDKIK